MAGVPCRFVLWDGYSNTSKRSAVGLKENELQVPRFLIAGQFCFFVKRRNCRSRLGESRTDVTNIRCTAASTKDSPYCLSDIITCLQKRGCHDFKRDSIAVSKKAIAYRGTSRCMKAEC